MMLQAGFWKKKKKRFDKQDRPAAILLIKDMVATDVGEIILWLRLIFRMRDAAREVQIKNKDQTNKSLKIRANAKPAINPGNSMKSFLVSQSIT